VFAVAITLLILNISFPELSPNHLPDDIALWEMIGDKWPALVAYTMSFLTIGIMWLNHHRLFVHIKRIDTVLLFSNLLLLLVIVFIPFPTALLAEYIASPQNHAAAVLYSGTCLLMACCFHGLWLYASFHNRLLGKDVDTAAVKAISRQYFFGPFSYLIVFGIAWINTTVCVTLIVLLALFFALPSRTVSSLSIRGSATVAPQSKDEPIEELEL
jgi:uncharacterized membrane protein